jgi:hypothetical protein
VAEVPCAMTTTGARVKESVRLNEQPTQRRALRGKLDRLFAQHGRSSCDRRISNQPPARGTCLLRRARRFPPAGERGDRLRIALVLLHRTHVRGRTDLQAPRRRDLLLHLIAGGRQGRDVLVP